MSVETPVPEQVQPLIDFASKDGAFRVQLDIPDQWPLWSTPIEIISCTAANGAECFSRYLLVRDEFYLSRSACY